MARARIAAVAALVLILALGATVARGTGAVAPDGDARRRPAVAWPPSTGLLVARGRHGRRVRVGRVRRADERSRRADGPRGPRGRVRHQHGQHRDAQGVVGDLAARSSPGRHLLIANASGIYAARRDATYSGGFAATGGAIVLRPIGGQPIDAVGWGDATNAFVEGTAAPAPAAGQLDRAAAGRRGWELHRHERQRRRLRRQRGAGRPEPGGRARTHAVPERVAVRQPRPAVPRVPPPRRRRAPPASPSPAPRRRRPDVAPTPTPTPTGAPTPTPTPTARRRPTPRPRRRRPRRRPTPAPTEAATPTPAPTPTASRPDADALAELRQPSPTMEPVSIEAVARHGRRRRPRCHRGRAHDGPRARWKAPGAASSRTRPAGSRSTSTRPFDVPVAAGSRIRASGVVDSRFGQRTLRVDRADVTVLGEQWLPTPLEVQTGAAAEPLEGPSAPARRDRHRGAERPERRTRPDDRRRLGRGAGDRRAGRARMAPIRCAGRSWSRAARSASATAPGPASRGTASTRRLPASSRSSRRRRRPPRPPTPTPLPSPTLADPVCVVHGLAPAPPTATPDPTAHASPVALAVTGRHRRSADDRRGSR